MSSLQTYVNFLPSAFVNRFTTSGHFLAWGNELLEELQERGCLSTTIKEIGQTVENLVWIDKPADFLSLIKVWNPEDPKHEYRVEDVNNKFKLLDIEIKVDSSSWETADIFTSYTVDSVGIGLGDITDKEEDELKNYLFRITGGTSPNLGIVLSGNDASDSMLEQTLVYFLHELDSALNETKLTEAELVPPWQYVMIKYHSIITAITALGDEFPIPTDCEKRLVPAWLRWCCERQSMATSNETKYWEKEKTRILDDIQASRLSRIITPSRGRRLAGFEKKYNTEKPHPLYSEFS